MSDVDGILIRREAEFYEERKEWEALTEDPDDPWYDDDLIASEPDDIVFSNQTIGTPYTAKEILDMLDVDISDNNWEIRSYFHCCEHEETLFLRLNELYLPSLGIYCGPDGPVGPFLELYSCENNSSVGRGSGNGGCDNVEFWGYIFFTDTKELYVPHFSTQEMYENYKDDHPFKRIEGDPFSFGKEIQCGPMVKSARKR